MEQGLVETAVNGGLLLQEYRQGIRFGTDALLLAAFARERALGELCADFGTGSGVIPLLLAASGSNSRFLGVELQEKYADLARENARRNGYGDRIEILQGDLREYRRLFAAGSVSTVVSNPPYLPSAGGKQNLAEEKRLAWHDETLPVEALASAAAWALKSGGRFCCVYLPSRLASLIAALKSHALEPKRMRLVAPSPEGVPSLVLLEAKKDAAEGMEVLPTLYLYGDSTHGEESLQMKEIYKLFD